MGDIISELGVVEIVLLGIINISFVVFIFLNVKDSSPLTLNVIENAVYYFQCIAVNALNSPSCA